APPRRCDASIPDRMVGPGEAVSHCRIRAQTGGETAGGPLAESLSCQLTTPPSAIELIVVSNGNAPSAEKQRHGGEEAPPPGRPQAAGPPGLWAEPDATGEEGRSASSAALSVPSRGTLPDTDRRREDLHLPGTESDKHY